MIVWVTGARGFIGQHVCRHFAARGHFIVGIGHGHWPEATAQAGLDVWLNGDITISNLKTLCSQGGTPDLVVHLAGGSSVSAALANPKEDFQRTVTSTAELLEWLRQEAPAARVLAISSAAVYGDGHVGKIDEAAPTNPVSPYGYHKLMMEQLCRSYAQCYGMRCVVLRLFSIYGTGLRKQLLWDLCHRLKNMPEKLELCGTGDELRDWLHVEDLLQALEAVLSLADSNVPVFNVGTGQGVSVRNVARMTIEAFADGRSPCRLFFNGKIRQGDPQSLVANTERLQALGFAVRRSLRTGIEEYVRWFRNLLKADRP